MTTYSNMPTAGQIRAMANRLRAYYPNLTYAADQAMGAAYEMLRTIAANLESETKEVNVIIEGVNVCTLQVHNGDAAMPDITVQDILDRHSDLSNRKKVPVTRPHMVFYDDKWHLFRNRWKSQFRKHPTVAAQLNGETVRDVITRLRQSRDYSFGFGALSILY